MQLRDETQVDMLQYTTDIAHSIQTWLETHRFHQADNVVTEHTGIYSPSAADPVACVPIQSKQIQQSDDKNYRRP